MFRCDVGKINRVDVTANGFLRIRATVAQVGWLKYFNDDGSERLEYVDSDTLFDKVHIDSTKGSTLTLRHPDEPVTPINYKMYSVGTTGTEIDENRKEGLLDILTVVCDKTAIDSVESGETTDISMGYTCDTIPLGDGTFKQVNRVCNHIALVEEGRADKAKLHLDNYQQSQLISLPAPKKIYLKTIDLTTV